MIDSIIFSKHLEEGEEIHYAVHKHVSEVFKPFLFTIFFGFMAPWMLYGAGFNTSAFLVVVIFWNLAAAFILFHQYIDWYSDVWLFTSMSIIIVEWHGLFSNTSQRVGYEDTEGVQFMIRGFWGTVLRYGDITLRVVSGSHVTLQNASHPKRAELGLIRAQGQYMQNREMVDANGLKQLLSQMVAHHMRKK